MKKSVTFRLDTELLADARRCAGLQNLVEIVLEHPIDHSDMERDARQSSSLKRPTIGRASARRKA
jgi:hypothetical protein